MSEHLYKINDTSVWLSQDRHDLLMQQIAIEFHGNLGKKHEFPNLSNTEVAYNKLIANEWRLDDSIVRLKIPEDLASGGVEIGRAHV